MYKIIDINSWERKAHYEFYKDMDLPQYNICSNIDVTDLYKFVKKNNLSFYQTMIFFVTKVVNNVSEFKVRIKDENVIKYEKINPAFTINTKNELFSFATVEFDDDFNLFKKRIKDKVESLKGIVSLDVSNISDNTIYISCAPWINFTSVSHATYISKSDCIPRITWGKYIKDGERLKMPLSVQVHHALVDGYHLGLFYDNLQTSIIEELDKFWF